MFGFLSARPAIQFVRTLPPRMLVPLGIAVFFLFAMMGFIVDVASGGIQPWGLLVTNVIASGMLGVGYAYSGLRGIKHRIATGAAHAIYLVAVVQLFKGMGGSSTPEDVIARLRLDAVGIITCMAVSYSAFVRFTGTTGAQYLQTRAEIRLASEIHAVLVPRLERTLGQYEFYGISRASGDVGGDLVDLVESPREWIGYVADVSGHGVSSGVLMGMTKSAARMRLRAGSSLTSLANDLNDVLLDLKRPSMFVTFAGVRSNDSGALEYCVAGHLPILRVGRDGQVHEHTTPQIPLGMFPEQRFVSAQLECAPGELLAIVTDGLTEVFDPSDREFGLDQLKAVIAADPAAPLDRIADRVVTRVREHGPQLDDQTLLLIRRVLV